VDGVFAIADHRACRPERFGGARFSVRQRRCRACLVHAYYNAITKRLKKLADYEINPNMALVSFFMCAKTDEEARARADGATFFQFALRFYGASQNASVRARHRQHVDEYNKWKREIRKPRRRRCAAA